MPTRKADRVASSEDRLRQAAKTLFAERGFERTTTAAICRLAGTSQSQLIKYFTDKQGVLASIFENTWEQINPAVRLATESLSSPAERLKILTEMVLGFLAKDRAIQSLFLLEGRRIRGDGHMVVLVPGFIDFTKLLDGILKELVTTGQMTPNLHPQAFRSALMGAVEGMLRDHMLARTSRFPASYTESDMRAVISSLLSFFIRE